MVIEGKESFTEAESLEDMNISLTIRKEHMDAIVKAYIENSRLEEHFSRFGARSFSPGWLAKAQIHRSVKYALLGVIRLFSADDEDASYYLEAFTEDIHRARTPDMSLILKPETDNYLCR